MSASWRDLAPPARLEHGQARGQRERCDVVERAGDQARLGAPFAAAHRIGAGAEHERADHDHAEQEREL